MMALGQRAITIATASRRCAWVTTRSGHSDCKDVYDGNDTIRHCSHVKAHDLATTSWATTDTPGNGPQGIASQG